MKILALMRKETREIFPWVLLGVIVFASGAAFMTKMEIAHPRYDWQYGQIEAGKMVDYYSLFVYSSWGGSGSWLFVVSIAMGIAVGVRQFWIPFFTKTWQFELHRSVSRSTILFTKMFAAVMGICVTVGLLWTALYLYASRPGVFIVPPSWRNFMEGWVFTGMGLLVYLSISLAALTRAKWYTTKIFGPLFAAFIIGLIISQTSLYRAFGILVVGMVMLFSQAAYTFLNREF